MEGKGTIYEFISNRRLHAALNFILLSAALSSSLLTAQDVQLSGILDSTVNFTAGAGGADNSWGVEEYANLRLKADAGEKAVFYGSFNLVAVSGNFAQRASLLGQSTPGFSRHYTAGQNYAAEMELERLYFRINGDYLDTEAGLLRLAFGYGNVWGSSDFLNPRNPLSPDARKRGIPGMVFSVYPADDLKIALFGASPANPLQSGGGGIISGISLDRHWSKASIQALYAYQTPLLDSKLGLHRFGASLKADLELGFAADTLYIFNPRNPGGIEGLSAGAGFDYSFADGKFYILAEYLFNGNLSATSPAGGGSFLNHHYLYTNFLYRFNDYASIAFPDIFCFDDFSFMPGFTVEYELFQGMTLVLSAWAPLDRDVFTGSGRHGEMGPEKTEKYFSLDAKVRLRF